MFDTHNQIYFTLTSRDTSPCSEDKDYSVLNCSCSSPQVLKCSTPQATLDVPHSSTTLLLPLVYSRCSVFQACPKVQGSEKKAPYGPKTSRSLIYFLSFWFPQFFTSELTSPSSSSSLSPSSCQNCARQSSLFVSRSKANVGLCCGLPHFKFNWAIQHNLHLHQLRRWMSETSSSRNVDLPNSTFSTSRWNSPLKSWIYIDNLKIQENLKI